MALGVVSIQMEWTDRHYRYMMRLLTRHTTLYTEMIVDETVSKATPQGGGGAIGHALTHIDREA